MRVNVTRTALLALVLILAGCFRPAGDAIQPTPSSGQATSAPATAPLDDATDEPAAEESPLPDGFGAETTISAPGDVTATFPPITVIQPTRSLAATEPAPSGSLSTSSTAVSGTAQFTTPSLPGGPMDDTAVPTARGGALTATPSGMITPTDMFTTNTDRCIHVVQSGDTLYRIATSNNVSLEDMRAANPQLVGSDPILQPGDELTIPNCNDPAPSTGGQATAQPTSVTAPPGGETYTVEAGDTLYTIAQSFGLTVDELIAANTLEDPDRLEIGQVIIIPLSSGG